MGTTRCLVSRECAKLFSTNNAKGSFSLPTQSHAQACKSLFHRENSLEASVNAQRWNFLPSLRLWMRFRGQTGRYVLTGLLWKRFLFQIEYEIDEIQLSYLQLLSNHAQQMFTFKCKNSVAWYDENSRSFKKAVKFEGASGHEFSSKSKSKKAMIKVPHDGCKVILLIHSFFFFSGILMSPCKIWGS